MKALDAKALWEPGASHAGLSRAAVLGRTRGGRWSYAGIMASILALSILLAESLPGPVSDFFFIDTLLVIAVLSSAGITSTALRAQRLFGGALAPSGVLREWRRGWIEGQAMLAATLVAISLGASAWRGAGHDEFVLLPGAVVVAQALAVWGAFAFAGRGWRLRYVMSVAVVLVVAGHEARHIAVGSLARGAVETSLLIASALGLVIAGMQLGPSFRLAVQAHARRSPFAPIARLMQRWTPLSATLGKRWWSLWMQAGLNLFVVASQSSSGIWASRSLLLTRGSLILWFTCIVVATLSGQGMHWRIWLQPGGPRRDRLGRHLFSSTLQVYALMLVPMIAVASGVALLVGAAPHDIAHYLLRRGHFCFELLFSIALAVLISGLFFGLWSQQAIGMVIAGLAIVAVFMLYAALGGLHPVDVPETLSSAAGYDIALLALTVVFVTLADRAWARRNVNDLMRRLTPARPS